MQPLPGVDQAVLELVSPPIRHPSERRTHARALVLAVVAAAGVACAAKVARFDIVPSHVCAGTSVKLDMQVKGTPSVTVSPPLPQEPGQTYIPMTTTRFLLKVRRWPLKPVGSEAEVKVMPGDPPEPDEITASVTCQANKVAGSVQRPAFEWDPRLRVTTVESGEDREISISHAGRSATLTPQNPTTNVFAGTSPSGDWTLRSPLKPGEECGADLAPPNLLNVSAQVRCGN